MSASFSWWRKALEGSFGPVHENDPQPGFYKTKVRSGLTPDPVAILAGPDGVTALRAGRPVAPCEVWSWCCMQPIDEATYVAVAEHGQPWPDLAVGQGGIGHNSRGIGSWSSPAAEPSVPVAGEPAPGRPAGMASSLSVVLATLQDLQGSGLAGEVRPETLVPWLDALEADAHSVLHATPVPTTQAEADHLANYATVFALLESLAEAGRVAEKKPVLDKGRAIDRAWKAVHGRSLETKQRLKQAVERYLLTRFHALEDDAPLGVVAETDMPRAGTLGRRIGLRTRHEIHVVDWPALVAGYRDDARLWARQDVETALLGLAEADLAGGRSVAGALLVEKRSAA